MLAKVRICWLDSRFAVTIVMKIAATMSVLAAQRFGEEFGHSDGVGTCPIPTLASKYLTFNNLRLRFAECYSLFLARGVG